MKIRILAAISLVCLASPSFAQSGPLPVDAPIPNDLKERTFLPSAAVAGVRDKMERVVGYWAFVSRDGKINITTARPTSFSGGSAATKVTLGSGTPSYDGVLTKSADLNASIPVLGISWSNNQRGQVTITDTAQFIAGGDPSSTDWDNLPKATNGGHWVFVDSATVSVVQTSILTEKGGTLTALLGALNIGGKTYQALNGSSSSLIVSLFLKQNPIDLASGGLEIKSLPSLSVNSASLNSLSSQ